MALDGADKIEEGEEEVKKKKAREKWKEFACIAICHIHFALKAFAKQNSNNSLFRLSSSEMISDRKQYERMNDDNGRQSCFFDSKLFSFDFLGLS